MFRAEREESEPIAVHFLLSILAKDFEMHCARAHIEVSHEYELVCSWGFLDDEVKTSPPPG